MKHRVAYALRFLGLTLLSTVASLAANSRPAIFAQKLAEDVLTRHPELRGVELAIASADQCSTIASTNTNDVGEKCDDDEVSALRRGTPSVEGEMGGYDVTMSLHDGSGKVIGTVGLDFNRRRDLTKTTVVKRTEEIVHEIESEIPTQARLFEAQ